MLSSELKSQIQGAYSRFLEAKGLKARYGQRLMIAEVAKVLGAIKHNEEGQRDGEPAVVAVEAGTGTGKTVAYSLAAIPTAKAAGKRLVIATATVALQEQIVHKDLPDLMRNAGLQFSFALAKGRGRYLCLSKLDMLLQEGQAQSATAQMFEEEGFRIDVDEHSQKLYSKMIEKLAGNRWDGDRDSWPEELEDQVWGTLTTDHSQCTNRHCPNFQQCAFYKAREGMTKVDVIVTNHDMVLADLALGGGAVLPDPRETLYVFDEGHHLPDKAIGHFAHFTRLRSTADWLGQVEKNLTKLLAQHPLPGDLGRLIEQVPEQARELRTQQQFMFSACEQLADFRAGEDMEGRERPRHRFEGGLVPEHLRELGIELKKGFAKLTDVFTRLTELLKQAMDDEGTSLGLASHQAEEWYPLFGSLLARAQGNWELWTAFTVEDPEDSPPMARWLTLADSSALFDIEVNASPILAAETLRRNLWNVAYGALVTSATLTALGTFDRFRMRSGLPKAAVTAVVPSPFHHADAGVLRVPDLKADPRDAAAHTAAIIRDLPELVKGARGTLVLYSSRKQMQDVFDGLDRDWRKRVLIQGNLSKQETLNKHKARVDDGDESVLFGLASFAEGVDLPGAYCEHVVIAKIPFAVPDDPVEAALAEWIEARGGNPFMEIAVPDASLRLIQACGRLLRTEADRGTITLLDRRVVTQRYGKAILNALPPFRREIA
ncbi:ATP-dependent DNA helicase DinG [Pseudomonas sp. Gutcm_11s]|uniref:ATP-dependent DNA helicase DinG n=1 Tax=Pseudomonas sp. Gutcm_11s TaxID=3026088 RepID=UPI00235EF303|nr:ATP-dependent DNA helicase DinG [Pseudomonas sp. Gutcm_11s]MDD0844284.1 ATP-dependent DNA helicase DinG [Pseudomonas sp. Gutcm_11s]